MKKSNEQRLKEVIQEMLEAYKLREGLQISTVLQAWEEIAGPYIAKYTEKIYIRQNKLFIKLRSTVLKHELIYSKSELIAKINALAREELIHDIVFL